MILPTVPWEAVAAGVAAALGEGACACLVWAAAGNDHAAAMTPAAQIASQR